MNDVAGKLQVRADALMTLARGTYDQEMREVIYKVAFNLHDAVQEINRLEQIIYQVTQQQCRDKREITT